MFQEVLLASQQQNFEYLRSVLSDDAYNNYLLDLKHQKEKNVRHVMDQILPLNYKLVNFQIQTHFEIADVWVKFSGVDYVTSFSKTGNSDTNSNSGKNVEKEFLVTLVKMRTDHEDIICPSCGHVSTLLMQSDCPHCGVEIVNKHHRWVILKYMEITGNKK